MASIYRSNHSTSSARSAEPAELADMDDIPRLRPRSSDKFLVSHSRTRVPSIYMPHDEFRGIRTAGDLLNAEPGTSRTHQNERFVNHSLSRNVGPGSSASSDAGDRSTLRTQRHEIAAARPNTHGKSIMSKVDGEVEDHDDTEIRRTVQTIGDISDALGDASLTNPDAFRVVSAGSMSTSNRDFSGSSSSSQTHASNALESFNTYARQNGWRPLEDEETGNRIHCIPSAVKIVLLTSSLKLR